MEWLQCKECKQNTAFVASRPKDVPSPHYNYRAVIMCASCRAQYLMYEQPKKGDKSERRKDNGS